MKEYLNYPYIIIKQVYVPLAIIGIYIIAISVIGYGLYHYINNKSYQTIKWKDKCSSIFGYNILILMFLLAFSTALDSEHIIYDIVGEIVQFFRQIDILLYIAIFLAFLRGLRYRNCYTYINTLIKYFIYSNYFELTTILFFKCDVGEKGYIPGILQIVFGVSIVCINSLLKGFEFCKSEKDFSVKDDELFKSRRNQMDDILSKILTYTEEEQMTIFISDEWGGGKTFFANYLFNQLKKVKTQNTIWLNLVDFNNQESFIKQVFRKIQIELNSNNYYTGGTSEVIKYFETILNISVNDSIAKLISEEVRAKRKSIIDDSVSLTEVVNEFSQMLGNDRIIIILDDIDRCTDETIKSALKLFSEIIMLPKSIMVFVGDYEQLIKKPEFEDGFFDKYFMYNYNLKTVPYEELFRYYQRKIKFDPLGLPINVDLLKEIQEMFNQIIKWYKEEEEHGIAENSGLNKGQMRSVAVQESIELVKNMKEGTYELKRKLSNPRRVSRIFNVVYEKLFYISKVIKEEQIESLKLHTIFSDIILPAIIFYSLTKNVCLDQFWDICEDDFACFSDRILETIYEMSMQNDETNAETKVYRLLVYYYFSTRFQENENRREQFKEFYMTTNIAEYLKK